MEAFGIDIGGSGIKGAPVNIETGELLTNRYRLKTPIPALPESVADCVKTIVNHFDWHGPIGCGFPSVVLHGITKTAANVHADWINANAEQLLSECVEQNVVVINDADAAGIAEMQFGAGKNYQQGVVVIVTIGTGLGTAVFSNGCLVPNTEFGHLEIDGKDAEARASDAVRQRESLSWKRWAIRFNKYLQTLERLMWPDLFILGGGASKKFDKFLPMLNVRAEVVPAMLKNEAGIVGAALATTIRNKSL